MGHRGSEPSAGGDDSLLVHELLPCGRGGQHVRSALTLRPRLLEPAARGNMATSTDCHLSRLRRFMTVKDDTEPLRCTIEALDSAYVDLESRPAAIVMDLELIALMVAGTRHSG